MSEMSGTPHKKREKIYNAEELNQLVKQAVAGDKYSINHLFEQIRNFVFAIMKRLVKNTEEAEDLTAEVLIKIYNNLPSYNPQKSGFLTWVTTITRNTVIDCLRKAHAAKRSGPTQSIDQPLYSSTTEEDVLLVSDILPATSDPEEELLSRERLEILRKLIKQLPEIYRTPFELRYFYGLSYKEIAEKTNTPLNNVRTRLRRARLYLEKIIKKGGWEGTLF